MQQIGNGLQESKSSTQTKHQVEGALLLDVVVTQGTTILKLLAREDQTLLIRGDALLALDLGLDVLDGVRRRDLQSDSLARERLHEDLHATTTKHKAERVFLLVRFLVHLTSELLPAALLWTN